MPDKAPNDTSPEPKARKRPRPMKRSPRHPQYKHWKAQQKAKAKAKGAKLSKKRREYLKTHDIYGNPKEPPEQPEVPATIPKELPTVDNPEEPSQYQGTKPLANMVHERFCQCIANGMWKSDAWVTATRGVGCKNKKQIRNGYYRCLSLVSVHRRIEFLRSKAGSQFLLTRARLAAFLEDVIEDEEAQLKDKLAAARQIAQMQGWTQEPQRLNEPKQVTNILSIGDSAGLANMLEELRREEQKSTGGTSGQVIDAEEVTEDEP